MINIFSIEELRNAFNRYLFAYTDKVTKISPNSTLSAIGYGVAILAQRILGEAAVLQTYIDPELATGDRLDDIARQRGVTARRGAQTSTTYVRISFDDTQAVTLRSGIQVTGDDGIVFQLTNYPTTTFPANTSASGVRFVYALATSLTTGSNTNVGTGTLTSLQGGAITGVRGVINEVPATGGSDAETDDAFRDRILNIGNVVAEGTLAKLQAALSEDSSVTSIFATKPLYRLLLMGRVNRQARTSTAQANVGVPKIGVITQNLSQLSDSELMTLQGASVQYLPLNTPSVVFVNVEPVKVSIDARLAFSDTITTQTQRKEVIDRIIQRLYALFRDATRRRKLSIERSELLFAFNNDAGISFLNEQFFSPFGNIRITDNLPITLESVIIRDLQGANQNLFGSQFTTYYV